MKTIFYSALLSAVLCMTTVHGIEWKMSDNQRAFYKGLLVGATAATGIIGAILWLKGIAVKNAHVDAVSKNPQAQAPEIQQESNDVPQKFDDYLHDYYAKRYEAMKMQTH